MSNIYDNFMRIYGQIKSETLQAEHVRILLFGAKTDRQIYEKHGVYAEPECNEPFLEPCHLGFKVTSKYGPIEAEVLEASSLLPKFVFLLAWNSTDANTEGVFLCQGGKALVRTKDRHVDYPPTPE